MVGRNAPLRTKLMTRLPQFIRQHSEEILVEWEAFARTLPMSETMDVAALRDHAKAILLAIAQDLETAQTPRQQAEKSKGQSDAAELGPPSTAAQEHGAARAESGFSMGQMLAELRALRATVIRLWTREVRQARSSAPVDLEDMTRFNEAIDQVIAESVMQFSGHVRQTRDRFLAILGHDLRNPIGAIVMSASFLLETADLSQSERTLVGRIKSSGRRMNEMVADLLDFTRARLGGDAIPITRAPVDAAQVVREAVSEVSTRYPARAVDVHTNGDLRGEWDGARLTQVVTNLVSNAVQHGTEGAPITVAARGTPSDVIICVRNDGPAIPAERLGEIFEAGATLTSARAPQHEHLGLGLFIVDRIVAAHGGSVDVRSTKTDGTTFTVRLPRHLSRAA